MPSAAAMLNRHRHVPDPAFQPKLLVSNAGGFVGVINYSWLVPLHAPCLYAVSRCTSHQRVTQFRT